MAPDELRIVGAGPAGSAAAIAAVTNVGTVRIFERSRSEHHKVCGEFISPEACRLLEAFAVWDDFLGRNPTGITRCILHFGSRTKEWPLAERGFGLSRLALDRLLLRRATALGATVCHDPNPPVMGTAAAPVIAASGRRSAASRGRRLFGYKAHFQGPANDAVELYFSRVGYMGVSAVEDNLTNVCGLAPEDVLRRYDFRINLNSAVRRPPRPVRHLPPMISNCGADHLLGDKRFFCNRLQPAVRWPLRGPQLPDLRLMISSPIGPQPGAGCGCSHARCHG
jgi:hypothetical protein